MKRSVADSCREYVESLETDGCEVTAYLCDDAKRWMATHGFKHLEVHHISGRPTPVERNNFCNLIHVSAAAHAWCHNVNEHKFELACWYAKLQKHIANLDAEDTGMRNRRNIADRAQLDDWHHESLDRCVTPFMSYSGRVSLLADRFKGTVYAKYGKEILKWVNEQ